MGVIGTRSLDRKIPGIEQIVAEDEKRIRAGIGAYDALEKLKANDPTPTLAPRLTLRPRISATGCCSNNMSMTRGRRANNRSRMLPGPRSRTFHRYSSHFD